MAVLPCGFGELAKRPRKPQRNMDYSVPLGAKKIENVLQYSKKIVLNISTSSFDKCFLWRGRDKSVGEGR